MDKDKDIKNRMLQEIEKQKFNTMEVLGFKTDPQLALLAGAAIGYLLGIKDAREAADI